MRTYLPRLQLVTTTFLVLVGLGLFFWYIPVALPISRELGSLPNLLRTLRQQAETEERLEVERERIAQKQRQTQAILEDLLARRCTLQQAGAHFQALCDKHDCFALQASSEDPTLSLEELFTRHVLELARCELKRQPAQAGRLCAQLEEEWAQLRASDSDAPWTQEPWLN